MIKAFIIGRLGKDCTTNNVNGSTVINFTVAHSEKVKDSSGGLKEKTTWAECAYWTEKTGIAPYLLKGTQVYVEGTPDARAYTTSDGKHGAALTIRVQSVQLLGSKSDGDASSSAYSNRGRSGSSSSSSDSDTPTDTDDLPF